MQPFLGSWDALEEGSCDLRRAKQPLSTASSAAKAWGSQHPRHPRRQPSTAGGVGVQGAGWGMSAAHRISPPLQRWWRVCRWRRWWRTVEQLRQRLRRWQRQQCQLRRRRRRRQGLSAPGCGRWQGVGARRRRPKGHLHARGWGEGQAARGRSSSPSRGRWGGGTAGGPLACNAPAASPPPDEQLAPGAAPWRQPTARGLPETPPAICRRRAEARWVERVDFEGVGLHAAFRAAIER